MGNLQAATTCTVGRALAIGEVIGGLPGSGAGEAWCGEALHGEFDFATGRSAIEARFADLRKCFDKLVRLLTAELLRRAGMPSCIFRTCKSFLDALQVRSGLALDVGALFTSASAPSPKATLSP